MATARKKTAAPSDSVEAQVGQRIRELREGKGITLEQLAAGTRLTKGQLSCIENGKVSSPVSTLTRIAVGLGVGPGAFFADGGSQTRAVLVKKSERKAVAGRGSKLGHTYELLAFGLPFAKDFEPYLMTIDRKIDPARNVFRHPGHEFLFLLEGKMTYRHRGENFSLEPGDALFFDGSYEHGPVAVSGLPVRFLSVISNTPGQGKAESGRRNVETRRSRCRSATEMPGIPGRRTPRLSRPLLGRAVPTRRMGRGRMKCPLSEFPFPRGTPRIREPDVLTSTGWTREATAVGAPANTVDVP